MVNAFVSYIALHKVTWKPNKPITPSTHSDAKPDNGMYLHKLRRYAVKSKLTKFPNLYGFQ